MPPGEDGLYTLLMDNNALVQLIVDALDDVKGQDIRVYDTTDKTSAFERVIVVSGTSNRQTRALAISAARAVNTGSRVWKRANGCSWTAAASLCTACSLRSGTITTLRNSGAPLP